MTTTGVTIRNINRDELLSARVVRRREMLCELNPPADLVLDPADLAADVINIAAFSDDGSIISAVRVAPVTSDATVYELSRMFTAASHRRQGYGMRVLVAAEQAAIERGAKAFVADSRDDARSFYARAGYWDTGRTKVLDNGSTNYIMVKQVQTNGN
jgi:predicted GNAT family N-acyltransferase